MLVRFLLSDQTELIDDSIYKIEKNINGHKLIFYSNKRSNTVYHYIFDSKRVLITNDKYPGVDYNDYDDVISFTIN